MIENKNRNTAEARSIAVAEDSRETDWKSKSFMASIFMGDLDLSLTHPFPEQPEDDAAIGDEICARIDAWAREHIDGDAIDRTGQIPAHVWKGLNDLGLFGIKIPKKYGGLGLSQSNYMRILGLLALHCGSVTATLSAHQSIGVPQPLKLFGTEKQKKKYLPRLARGEISAFALTEPGVGSDPANMATRAELSADGKHWILNGEKLWCTNGTVADLLVVMARTPAPEGSKKRPISAFIVETRWKGVQVVHRCEFMGIRAIENGLLRFNDVKVPAGNLIWGEGKGLRLALTTLNDGRLGIPAVVARSCTDAAEWAARWAKSREQWGKAVGAHEAGADKLARLSAGAWAMETFARFGAALSDGGARDLRMEAAAAKMFNTELGWELADTMLQLRAGRGFETERSLAARGDVPVPVERGLRDARINRIVEGTTDVMHLFLAREALDKHLKLAGPVLDGRKPLGERLKGALKAAGFYGLWYPRLWLGGLLKSYGDIDDRLVDHLSWVERRTRKLARALFHRMVLQGPKLEMRQLTLARMVEIGTELAVMALVISRTQSQLDRGESGSLTRTLYWLSHAALRVDQRFAALHNNSDALARELAAELIAAAEPMPVPAAPDLTPIPREWGSDLTSGRQKTRRRPSDSAEVAAK